MPQLKNGQFWKSADGEYIYVIVKYDPKKPNMEIDILDSNLNTITTKENYSVESFLKQINETASIVFFNEIIV